MGPEPESLGYQRQWHSTGLSSAVEANHVCVNGTPASVPRFGWLCNPDYSMPLTACLGESHSHVRVSKSGATSPEAAEAHRFAL